MGKDQLAAYRARRRFDETTEPRGAPSKNGGALYIIQKHDATRLHYDFRLELDGVLLSWAVTRGPSYNTKDKRLAVRTEDHPLEYGAFEGNIPAGNYGAGTVMLWDKGTWAPVGDARAGLETGKLAFILSGERLKGHWALVRMKPRPKERRENWLLIKENDELANTHETLLEDETSSVVSGRDLAQIAKASEVWTGTDGDGLPDFCEPMLATLVEAPPAGADWNFEIKYDGYRALIAADGGRVKIHTRSGLDWTAKFPGIAKAAGALKLQGALIDTEICVLDAGGRSDFAALVTALETGKGNLTALAFDLLFDRGADLRAKPLAARKALLQKRLGQTDEKSVIAYSEDFPATSADTGAKLLAAACARNLEGIIAKKSDAPYRAGRHGDWLKIKCGHGQEFVIIGFAPSEKSRPFASLLMAVREDGVLRYAGRVGSGFSDADLKRLAALRDKHKTKSPPAENIPAAMRRGVTWVKPVLAAAVEFAGWTRDDQIRHGRFKGLRRDKPAETIVKEIPTTDEAPISNPDKVMDGKSGVTKQDLAGYLQAAAPFMMPYIASRFISLVRAPGGIGKKPFFQRHPAAGFGKFWLEKNFEKRDGSEETYIYFKRPEALTAAVQMSTLEFHIWGSQISNLEKPDRIVFDLDPDEAIGFQTVKSAAHRVRDVLEALDLQSFPLISGGKGIHIVVPIVPQHEWPIVKDFAAQLAQRITDDDPGAFVATMSKAKRRGKIFIDHFRNERGATAIAPYSPRARPGAPVAWPVAWAALDGYEAASDMPVARAAAALAEGENGWAGYHTVKQRLTKAAIKATAAH